MSAQGQLGSRCTTTKIRYPRSGENIPQTAFFATGVARPEHNQLIGVFSKDGTAQMYLGRTLRQPPEYTNWVIYFKVPGANFDGTFTLSLYQANDPSGEPLDVVRKLKFRAPILSVFIAVPENDEDCCSDFFFSYGSLTLSDTNISSATMTRKDMPTMPTSSNAPLVEDGNWFMDWNPLSESDIYKYDLNVLGDGGGSDTRVRLHLHTRYCPP